MRGANPAVTDTECLNCWNAVYAVGAGRHYIARIQGQPINTVIIIATKYYINRLANVVAYGIAQCSELSIIFYLTFEL